MTRRVVAGDFLTGDFWIDVPAVSASWRMRHRAGGDVSASLKWSSVKATRAVDLFNALEPWRCYLAVIEDSPLTGEQYVLEAGPITGGAYTLDSDTLTIPACSMAKYLAARILVDVDAVTDPAAWAEHLEDVSLSDIARRIVQLAVEHTYGDPPIVLPTLEGGSLDHWLKGYELASVWKRLEDVMDQTGGPDIAFEPRIRTDRLGIEWVMRVGTETSPMLTQTGSDWVWDAAARRGNVANIQTDADASAMSTRTWTVGQGTGPGTLIAHATDDARLALGWPLLETEATDASFDSTTALAARAAANLSAGSRPYRTWSFTARANQRPALGVYRPGDWARLYVKRATANRRPYLSILAPDGYRRSRIVEVSGDLGENVSIVLATQLEDR